MHPVIIEAFDRSMPMLLAQEQIAAIATASVAAGNVTGEDRDRLMRELRRDARVEGGRAERPSSTDDLRKGLGARGVGLVVVKREG